MAVDFARRALRTADDDPGVLGRAAMVLGRFGKTLMPLWLWSTALSRSIRALPMAGIGVAGCVCLPVSQTWRYSISTPRCVSIRAVNGAPIWPGLARLSSSRVGLMRRRRHCVYRSKRFQRSRGPIELWQPATGIWAGLTKRNRSSSGWCPSPRSCADYESVWEPGV
jgi:hypothetical protein